MRRSWWAGLLLGLAALPAAADARGYLHAQGTQIVDGENRPVILRGMGLGGWMLQEGYMLQLPELGQQHVVRRRIAGLIGEPRTAAFYRAWLDSHMTKADVDWMAAQGFNSIRLPMHYDLLMLPVEREPVAGRNTWLPDGFARIDRLVAWARANEMVVILDLHAAPGGQGTDNAISDRDPTKPSLWDSPANRRKTVALWRELARRYADEPAIGGYDLINEPNWDFDAKDGGGHGCKEERNAPLRTLQREITAAIRTVDRNHLIVAEGNCWGNNYKGVLPSWDGNMVLSFHKYWNRNTDAELADILALRDRYKVPVWLGESGENSNVWFRDAIALVERHGIGWAFWPLKKIGFNQPLEIVKPAGYDALVAYLTGKGARPSADAAYATLIALARNARFDRNIRHPDVIDAMFRQPHDATARPFRDHRLGARTVIAAVDYDLGPSGIAYRDRVDANYHVSTGGERVEWNDGRTYRNDGVDIGRDAAGAPIVVAFEPGEWLRYTVTVTVTAPAGRYRIVAEGSANVTVEINGEPTKGPATLLDGRNSLVVRNAGRAGDLRRLTLTRID